MLPKALAAGITALFMIVPAGAVGRNIYIRGSVTDSITGERLPYVNVYNSSTGKGTVTDENGNFILRVPAKGGNFSVSALGYSEKTVRTSGMADSLYSVLLSPVPKDLDEVVIKPGKNRYSKKNNPAVDLMEKIRKTSDVGNPLLNPYYSYDKYEKMVVGVNDFNMTADTTKKSVRKRLGFLENYTDTALWSGKRVLNLMLREKLSTRITSGNGKNDKEIVSGLNSMGINDLVDEDNLLTILEDVFREIDIYDNSISLLQNRFVSPLSPIAGDFYKFYLTDTVTVGGLKCVDLQFAPHNPETMGFNGDIFVTAGDCIPFVKRVSMRLPSATNLNYVENIYISQNFERDSLGNRNKVLDDVSVEFQIIPGTPRLYAHRVTRYDRFSYRKRQDFLEYYDRLGSRFVVDGADERPDDFWDEGRLEPLSRVESRLDNLMSDARGVPFLMWTERILMYLESGFVKTSKNSKFDYGPLNTTVSYNTVEGLRLRVGGLTTANLNPHLFARGYVAYGFKDRKVKYSAELEYSFARKKYHSREFCRHGFLGLYSYDVDMLGQHYLFTNFDNAFLSFKRKESILATYRRLGIFSYILELPNNFSVKASLRHETQEATRWVPFVFPDGRILKDYTQACFRIDLRYAPGEKFIQGKDNRSPVNMDAWVFQLTHEYGSKGFMGSAFELNRTELSVQKRLWFSAFGYTDIMLKAGMIWSQVYYPALMWPNANLSYTIQPEGYSLMDPMEFANDRYVSLDLNYFGNGVLFNHIPFIKKLKLREVVTFKGLMGGLGDRNNPAGNRELLRFPEYAHASVMTSVPYMEIGCGIDNILTFLRLDYVWRLTYRNVPGIDKSGLRVSLHFSF